MAEPSDGTPELRPLGERLYEALADGDVGALAELLAEDFEGDLSPGLPEGLGATPYAGRDAMLHAWGRIAQRLEIAPLLEDLHVSGATLIGRGRYLGRARRGGTWLDARFAHFWTVDGGRLSSVRQVTDTVAWHRAWGDTGP